MSMKSLEAAILNELRELTGKRSLRQKDIQEWSTGPLKQLDDETRFFLPGLAVSCAVKTEALPKPKAAKTAAKK